MSILSLQTYKTYKGINSDTEDAKTIGIVNSVNSFIESYCNRKFTDYYSTNKVEYFDGVNSPDIYPKVFPLVEVVSIKVSTDGGETYPTTLEKYTDYTIDTNNDRIVSSYPAYITGYFVNSSYPINSLQLTYKGGYQDVPEDLVLAGVNLVEYFLGEDYNPKKSTGSSSMETQVPDFTARLPAHIRRVLEHYRDFNYG